MFRPPDWARQPASLLELFILGNLAFLVVDIFLAHSINNFAHPAEWIPFYFSCIAPIVLVIGMLIGGTIRPTRGVAAWFGYVIGGASVIIGITGLILHLESTFFERATLHNLVYTAPFAAPLAYAGLGLLLIMNRMVDATQKQWAGWIVFFALGGFLGNFALSLADHAQNGFFNAAEWIAVAASALAVGFLGVALFVYENRAFLVVSMWLMVGQIFVGLLGAYFHIAGNLHGPMNTWHENFLYGAPVFAPLLFPNLALLAMLGIWPLLARSAHEPRAVPQHA